MNGQLVCLLAAMGLAWVATGASRTGTRPPAPAALPPRQPLTAAARFDFETDTGGWHAIAGRAILAEAPGRDGRALHLSATFPGEAVVRLAQPLDWSEARTFQVDIYTDAEAGAFTERAPLQVCVYVKDDEHHWYQTTNLFRPPVRRWARYQVDVSGTSTEWSPVGHYRPWSVRVRGRLREVGIKFFSRAAASTTLYVDNVTISPAMPAPRPELRLINFRTNAETVPRYGLFEVAFELSREYADPFDPETVDIQGTFIAPSGEVTTVPGFFYQNYLRSLEKNEEILTPVGRSDWRIRFAPREEGTYTYFITVDDGDRLETQRRTFLSQPSTNPGFVRVCRDDPRYFEFENGDFFYPIGHNIPAAFNAKGAEMLGVAVLRHRGTFAYDSYLDGMRRGGMNFARIWLAAWSFALEWSKSYDAHYHDLGQYNLENAWRLDYVLDKARRHGIYSQVALTTFGHYRLSTEFEGDWDYSPYNVRNGGFLEQPWEFWTNSRAQKYYRRMLRYIMARWGYETHIAGWELCNEIDLVSQYGAQRPNIIRWHLDCAETIRRYDQGRHLLTTNFANKEHDPALIALDEIAYSSTNHYNVNIVDVMKDIFHKKAVFRKPALMTECGYDFRGSTPELTERYIPICIWASYMMPFAGAGMQWWWDFIDDRDLYFYFRALARFAAGEDRRRRNLEMASAQVVDSVSDLPVPGMRAECLRNDQNGYLWVCDQVLFDKSFRGTPPLHEGKAVSLPGLRDGQYVAQYWDTHTGEVLAESEFVARGGSARFPLPPFRGNMAIKVKPAPAEKAVEAPSTVPPVEKPTNPD